VLRSGDTIASVTHTLIHPRTVRHDDAVDGGTSDDMRPMLYDSSYETMPAEKATVGTDVAVTAAGGHCGSGDELAGDGRAREIVARQTWEDVSRLQRPLHQ
jgi:diaminopimelate decarboxylase